MSDWNWTTVWHVGLAFVLFLVVPALTVGVGMNPDSAAPLALGILLFFVPAIIGAELTLIPRWRWQDTCAGAVAASLLQTLVMIWQVYSEGPLGVAGALSMWWVLLTMWAWFVGTAVAGTWLILRFIRRPS